MNFPGSEPGCVEELQCMGMCSAHCVASFHPRAVTYTVSELVRRDEQCLGVRLRARKSRAGVVYKESLVNIIVFCVLAVPGEGTAGNAVQMWQRSRTAPHTCLCPDCQRRRC